MPETTPTSVEIDREAQITLTWPDGIAHEFKLVDVRVNCPCAECRGLRERGTEVWPTETSPQPLTIASAEHVGGWGISLTWNDGHATGIYSWDLLRDWALEAQGIIEE